jgi:mediator of RNA polymerase II transcription subunit 17
LQQNWKVKRQRQTSIVPGNEGFTFDLFDNSYDQGAIIRSSLMSTVRVNHDAAGMLAINVSPELCHSLQFGFVSAQPDDMQKKSNENKSHLAGEDCSGETGIESSSGEECVKKTHSLLRDVHKAIFNEQVVLFFFGASLPCLVCPVFIHSASPLFNMLLFACSSRCLIC